MKSSANLELCAQTVQLFQRGDVQAFETIYLLESQRLGRFVRRYVRRADAAEDIFQEIWIKVWQHRAQLSDPDRFVSWMYQIARNAIFEQLRKKRQKLQISAFGDLPETSEQVLLNALHDPAAGPRQAAVARQWMQLVELEIRMLDPDTQEMLALRYGAGLGLREIAEVLRVPLGTVCTKVSRGLKSIRQSFEIQGLKWDGVEE